MKLLHLFGLACFVVFAGVGVPGLAQQQLPIENCPYPKGWKPTHGDLQRILSDHHRWADKMQGLMNADAEAANAFERRANFCNADLSGVMLEKTDLMEADLRGAKLNKAFLTGAELKRADLRGATLEKADLSRADLRWAKLNKADL